MKRQLVSVSLFLSVLTSSVLAQEAEQTPVPSAEAVDTQSDEERSRSMLFDWATIVDPDQDCSFKSTVTIVVPDTYHNLHPQRGMNAPRLLKKVKGDFTVQVRVICDLNPGQESQGVGTPFNGAGLLIWESKDNFLRLERNCYRAANDLYCYPPLIEHWNNGEYKGFNSRPVPADEFFEGGSTWLRLSRRGDQLTASYSHDGTEWTDAEEMQAVFPDEVSVGVAALNTSNEPFLVGFEAFAIKLEEPPGDPVTVP